MDIELLRKQLDTSIVDNMEIELLKKNVDDPCYNGPEL